MSDQDQRDQAANAANAGNAGAAGGAYETPELAICESDSLVVWASDVTGQSPPDDTPKGAAETSAAPAVLLWSVPQPQYEYPDPELFTAPQNPSLRLSGPKRPAKQTHASGHRTVAHSTKARLTGHDAFGGSLCACNMVCTCNVVCTCESVATCSCVSHTTSGGGGGGGGTTPPPPTCSCNADCACQGVSTCPAVTY